VKSPAILVLGAALLAIAVFPSYGQDTAPGGLRCVVYTVRDVSADGGERDYEQTITAAVGTAFSSRGYVVLPESSWREAAAAGAVDADALRQSSVAVRLARAVGADLAVTGLFSVRGDEITYAMQCWEVTTGRLASSAEQTTPFNLAFFSALSLKIIDDLLPSLRPVGAPRPAGGSSPGEVVFSSPDEGMEMRLAGDLSIGKISNGHASWAMDGAGAGQKVLVEKIKKGYHRSFQAVTLAPGREIVLAPLAKEHAFAAELNWTFGQLLGAGAAIREYLVPDWFFLFQGDYFFVQPPVTFSPRAVIHDDLYLGLGGYVIFSPDSPIRLGISAGAGAIVSLLSTPGFPTYVDLYLDVANIWIEARIGGAVLFLRQDYKYSLGAGVNLLGQGWMVNRFPPTTLGVLFQ
jgi:hypothetical protein